MASQFIRVRAFARHVVWLLLAWGPVSPLVAASEHQKGDIVVVVEPTELKVEEKSHGSLPLGAALNVQEVRPGWLWVTPASDLPWWELIESGGQNVSESASLPGRTGWVETSKVVAADRAFEALTRQIRSGRNPQAAHAARADLLLVEGIFPPQNWIFSPGAWQQARDDYDASIRLGLRSSGVFTRRAVLLADERRFPQALADLAEATRLDPKNIAAIELRRDIYQKLQDYPQVLGAYTLLFNLEPQDGQAHAEFALLRATCPDARFRDGKQALAYATKAVELSAGKNAQHLAALAAAYAETEEFPQAVETSERAIALAPVFQQAELRQQLELYKAAQPLRQEPAVRKSPAAIAKAIEAESSRLDDRLLQLFGNYAKYIENVKATLTKTADMAERLKQLADEPTKLPADLQSKLETIMQGEEQEALAALKGIEKVQDVGSAMLMLVASKHPLAPVRLQALQTLLAADTEESDWLGAVAVASGGTNEEKKRFIEGLMRRRAIHALILALFCRDENEEIRLAALDAGLEAKDQMTFLYLAANDNPKIGTAIFARLSKLQPEDQQAALYWSAKYARPERLPETVRLAVDLQERGYPIISAVFDRKTPESRAEIVKAYQTSSLPAERYFAERCLREPKRDLRRPMEAATP